MPPKIVVKLKSDVPRVSYSDEDFKRDWNLAVGMVHHLLLHALRLHHRIASAAASTTTTTVRSGAGQGDEETAAAHAGEREHNQQDAWLSFMEQEATQAAHERGATTGSGVSYSCEEVSTSVRNMVRNGRAKELYESGLIAQCHSFLLRAMRWLREHTGLEPVSTLRGLTFLWRGYTQSLHYITAVYAELGQSYVLQHTTEHSIRGVGVKIFCDLLKSFPSSSVATTTTTELLDALFAGMLHLLDNDRRGFAVDREIIQTAREITIESQTYFTQFEPQLEHSTKTFYSQQVAEWLFIECLEGDAFFLRVHQKLHEEKLRIAACMDAKSKARLEEATQRALLEPHGADVFSNAFAKLAEEDNFAAIRMGWKLLSLRFIAKGDTARGCLRDYVVAQGTAIVMENNKAGATRTAAAAAAAAPSPPPPPATAADAAEGSVITLLLSLYEKAQQVVRRSFDSMEVFSLTLREAMQAAIRPKESKTAEALARFLDSFLRDGARRETEEDIERSIDGGMRLFSFIPAKDVFEAFYAELLAKRLIHQRVRSLDLERQAIRKIKDIVGTTSSMKLEGMLKDMATNEDLNRAYQETTATSLLLMRSTTTADDEQQQQGEEVGDGESDGVSRSAAARLTTSSTMIDVKYLILTVGYWPTFPKMSVTMPPQLKAMADHFTSYYCGRHGGRRLEWLPAWSSCVVRAQFGAQPNAKRDITMSYLQAVMLLLFNDKDSLSLQEMCSALTPVAAVTSAQPTTTNETDKGASCGGGDSTAAQQQAAAAPLDNNNPEVVCALLSISGAPTQRILQRQSGSTSAAIAATEVFALNTAFTHRQLKFRINQVVLRDQAQDAQVTKDKTIAERTYVVDAAIVRYMKSRRRATHTDLINDVIAMLKFPASSVDVKKRVEVLIEREYLRRDASDASMYEYIA